MDSEQRRRAALTRMDELKAVHLPLTRPCSECRFGPLDGSGEGKCEHYAHWNIRADPLSGRRKGHVSVTTAEARDERGLCGPEGLLFEPFRPHQKVAKWMATTHPIVLFQIGLAVTMAAGSVILTLVGAW